MKVVKNIHNNISLCIDSKGNEVVAFGKGIGFMKPPYEVPIQKVERTFYNINPIYIDMLSQIPEEAINVSSQIIDYANKNLKGSFNENLIFTLADHITFSIKRLQENIHLDLPLIHEVKHMYPKEIQIGEYALKLIKEKLNVELPKQEAAVITLHVVDYRLKSCISTGESNQEKIERCTQIIEEYNGLKIDREGFNYSRFVSHMYYLLDRIANNTEVKTKNQKIFDQLVKEYPKTYDCAKKACRALEINPNDEELLYLILHINRLSSREEKQ